ncbi:cobalamin-binding protein [Ferruginibacter sp. HRS2-29]|nr:cobalamin-binding protein [Ferruginibacter sp. HRS2-29]
MFLQSPNDVNTAPKRIISLVPSITELLHHLGLEEETVGITKFCIHPDEWFRSKARIGGTKTIHLEKVKELQPDLIIASKEENIKEQVEALAKEHPVWLTDVNNLEDALEMIIHTGKLTGRLPAAEKLVEQINEQFLAIQPLAAKNGKLRTAYLIWKDPYMAAGTNTYINSMLRFAGFTNAFAHLTRYPEVSIEAMKASECQLVLLSSEPYPFSQKHINELQLQLPGVKILLVDGEIFSWYGNHLLKAPSYFEKLSDSLVNSE